MRDYAKISPQFWSGHTGKRLKAQGSEAVIVGLYLLTCQHANMIGLYYLSPAYIAADTGLGSEGALKGLQGACEADFCRFDAPSEVVWVPEMAAYQIGEKLDPKDNRCKGIQREYDSLPDNPFLGLFYERYGAVFNMVQNRAKSKGLPRPSKAPPKPRAGARKGAGAGEGGTAPEARELSAPDLVAEGIPLGIAETWMKVRAKKKAPLTVLAWDGVKREAGAAGMTPTAAVQMAAENNWQGFQASWVQKANGHAPNRQEAVEQRNEAARQAWLRQEQA